VQGAFTTIQAVTRTGGGVCHCQFLPRMVAVAVTLLPVLWAPFAFNLIALTVDGGCCALFSLPAYRHLVRSDWLRVGCCALFAATLCAGSELIGTLTNMPWYLALAAVGAVALRSESVAEMRGRHLLWIATGAALCAASSPVVMVAAPVARYRRPHLEDNRHSGCAARRNPDPGTGRFHAPAHHWRCHCGAASQSSTGAAVPWHLALDVGRAPGDVSGGPQHVDGGHRRVVSISSSGWLCCGAGCRSPSYSPLS